MAKYLTQLAELANLTDDLKRRKKQADRFDTYVDDFDSQILTRLKKQFHEQNYERLYYLLANYYNIFKKCVNAKSVLYKKQAVRKLMKQNGKECENYSDTISDSNINTAFQTLNKYTNINNIAFMRIKSDPIEKVIVYEPIPSENLIILQDDNNPLKTKAILHKIVLQHYIGDVNYYWMYYDDEIIAKCDDGFSKLYDIRPNPYIDPNDSERRAIIPYVPVWAIQPVANDYWNITMGDDLYNASLQINIHLTHFNASLKAACYKQIVFTGVTTEDIERIYGHITDMLSPIALTGESAKADTLALATDFEGFMTALDMIAARVLDQHGFDVRSQRTSAQAESGFAIQLRRESLQELREEQQPIYRKSEQRIAYCTAIVGNTDLKSNIDVNGKLMVTFGQEEYKPTQEETAVLEWEMQRGLKSPYEVYSYYHPDVPEEDIPNKIAENKQIYQSLFSSMSKQQNEINNAFQKETQNNK